MIRILQLYHGELFRFWYGKNEKLSYYHGKKFNEIQSLPICEVSGGIQFKSYHHRLALVAQSATTATISVLFAAFLVAQCA